MSLDLSSLRDALGARNASLGYLDSELATDSGLRDQFRAAAEAGLVGDVSQFHAYRETRNITSHSYNRQKAERIVSGLPQFAVDIGNLLEELEARVTGRAKPFSDLDLVVMGDEPLDLRTIVSSPCFSRRAKSRRSCGCR